MNIAIVCAGGNGERMHTKENKIFLEIDKKPLIYYTLKMLCEYDGIDRIVVTTRPEDKEKLGGVVAENDIDKIMSIEDAENTRQESTYKVLMRLKAMDIPKESYVLIHNAVNPFVTHSELDECLGAARRYGASLLGFEASDTMKIVNEGCFIEYTPDRSSVWIAQTPQVLRFDIALTAFESARCSGLFATDDTTLVEAIHEKVKFVQCSRENFKITYPQDMDLARRIHTKRVKEKSVWYA